MRNLKKILALVLALVMSLSLMATASAADFADVSDDNPYKVAIDVLEGLKVFQGYQEDGTFRPEASLTRAQAAALVYRIATGDAEDQYVANYTDMAQSKFTDLDGYNWARGYINYCQNAEIVKGKNAANTIFDPGATVSGYQLMAMVLRTMGYGKNGEFEGNGWELQTSTIAERIGILKGVTSGDYGSPAPRQMVAQILFNAMLTETVDYTTLNGYQPNGKTLGKEKYNLESIEGVIVANEFANLYGDSVLAEGKTNFEVKKDDVRRLDITSQLTDIGESFYAYTTGSRVLTIGKTDKNTVKEGGNAIEIDTAGKFQAAAGMPAASDIEYYVNFGRVGNYTCDQRLEFNVVFRSETAMESFEDYTGEDVSWIAAQDNSDNTPDNNWSVEANVPATGAAGTNITNRLGTNDDYDDVITAADYPVRYSKIIRAGNDISDADLNIIRGIFGAADNIQNNVLGKDGIDGGVYVGTVSTSSTITIGGVTYNIGEENDLSNKISYNEFFNTYINPEVYDVNWNVSANGQWWKFVDNDGDGRADYAFLTQYYLDEAVNTYKSGDKTVLDYYGLDEDAWYSIRYLEDIAVGDVVIYTFIDGQALVEKADFATKTVTDYNWRNDEIKTTDGDTYGQSGIWNDTQMQQLLSNMADKAEYTVYFDKYGYVRAYKLPGETTYALLTEVYATSTNNGNLVRNLPLTVELKVKDAAAAEYALANPNGNDMVSTSAWTQVMSYVGNYNYNNFLQPAIGHAGVTRSGFGPVKIAPTFATTGAINYVFWNQNRQVVKAIDALGRSADGRTISGEFNYGPYTANGANSAVTTSFTNVAKVNISGDKATVTGAAELRLDRNGNVMRNANGSPRYSVDYIQLSTSDIAKGATRYPIAGQPAGETGYVANNNTYVNAIHSTEYYIAYNGNVFYVSDYVNFPGLTGEKNGIRAAYAVARDTSADDADRPYWVADVIVYEVASFTDLEKVSISLAYYNPSRNTDQIQAMQTLNNKSENPMITVVPNGANWDWSANGGFNSGYGFYHLYNTSLMDNGELASRNAEAITENFNSNKIFAGIVTRQVSVGPNGDYIDIDTDGDGVTNWSVSINNNVYSITTGAEVGSRWAYNEAAPLRYSNVNSSEVKAGDRVIWVVNDDNDKNNTQVAGFVVDLGNDTLTGLNSNVALRDATAAFLYSRNAITGVVSGLWESIMSEQRPGATYNVTIEYKTTDGATPPTLTAIPGVANRTMTVAQGGEFKFTESDEFVFLPGYNFAGASASAGTIASNGYGVWSISPVTSDITITLMYTAGTYDFSVTDSRHVGAANYDYSVAGATLTTGPIGAAVTASYKDTFEVEIPVDALYSISVSVANGKITGEGLNATGTKYVVKGEIYGSTVLTINETKAANVASINSDSTTISAPAEALVGNSVNFTYTPSAGSQLWSLTWNISGTGKSGTIDVTSGTQAVGVWTYALPAEALEAGKLTTISVVEVPSAPFNVAVTTDAAFTGTLANLTYAIDSGAQSSLGITSLATPVNVSIQPGNTLVIGADVAINVTCTGATIPVQIEYSADGKTCTITGCLNAGITLAIANAP